jgi:hypothetical protein
MCYRPTFFIVAARVFTVRAFLVDSIVRLTGDYNVALVASGLHGEPELQRTLEGVAFVDIMIARRPALLTDLPAWLCWSACSHRGSQLPLCRLRQGQACLL